MQRSQLYRNQTRNKKEVLNQAEEISNSEGSYILYSYKFTGSGNCGKHSLLSKCHMTVKADFPKRENQVC